MGWYNRECPTDSRDAYYEGRRSREYESNPYEHGRDQFYGSCRDAYDEFERGQRAARYDRELEREQEEQEERRRQRRHEEQREYERMQEEAAYNEAMEAQYREQIEPEPSTPMETTEGQP